MIPAEEVSTEPPARRSRPRCRSPTPSPTSPPPRCSSLGLRSADLDLVARGLADRIHQPRRRDLYPRSMELVDAAPELGALGATISGAGPTVLVWVFFEQTGALVERLREEVGRLGRGPPAQLRRAGRRRRRAIRIGDEDP